MSNLISSYYVEPDFNENTLANLYKLLDDHKLKARILLTENRFLDFLPFRASKGSAVRYLSSKWKIPIERFITAGNSGNDEDMLKGKMNGIVVANYSPELEPLKKQKLIYFTKDKLAKGVLEGIQHYLASVPRFGKYAKLCQCLGELHAIALNNISKSTSIFCLPIISLPDFIVPLRPF